MNKENIKDTIKEYLAEYELKYYEDIPAFGYGLISIPFGEELNSIYQLSGATKIEIRNSLRKAIKKLIEDNLKTVTHQAIQRLIISHNFDDSKLGRIFRDQDWLLGVVNKIDTEYIGLPDLNTFESKVDEAYCNKDTETVIYRIGEFAFITDKGNFASDNTKLNGRSLEQVVKEDFFDELKETDQCADAWEESELSYNVAWV